MQAEVSVVVVVVVTQQVLHGALQQAVLQVLLHRDLTHTNTHGEFSHIEENLLTFLKGRYHTYFTFQYPSNRVAEAHFYEHEQLLSACFSKH